MPRVVDHDQRIARRIDAAVEAIQRNEPTDPALVTKAAKGILKLNFASVQAESGVKRHLFDKPRSIYAAQYELISTSMAAKGKVEPLALQLAECRRKLARSEKRLESAQTYNAHLLTLAHQFELEVARLREQVATLLDQGPDEPIVGSGRLIGLPTPERRRIGPGQGRRKAR
ncbi:hypothetical protein [Sphingomonas melonis]|uniref:Uncharacterized protein n=1 Tax=Sphingomonas melonis TaxID=152682 RepID=A0A7Y9K291_9SPHN|nr:hypothetical protein [Sphingomonas melonis]NYD89180.1 hypothetical protein [Sphingomonas melonis]